MTGASVRPDDDSTVAMYGRKPDFKNILGGGVAAPQGAQNFLSTVRTKFNEVHGNGD